MGDRGRELRILYRTFVRGKSFRTYEKKQHLTPREAANFIVPIFHALHYLHSKNIVHRDMKLENIMLREDGETIVLIDFGDAKEVNDQEYYSEVVGTPYYVPP